MSVASVQFSPVLGDSSDQLVTEHSVRVVPVQTGAAHPKSFRSRVTGLSAHNMSTSGRRTAWEVSHSADNGDPFDTPLPYDSQTGGKSYRDFPQG